MSAGGGKGAVNEKVDVDGSLARGTAVVDMTDNVTNGSGLERFYLVGDDIAAR